MIDWSGVPSVPRIAAHRRAPKPPALTSLETIAGMRSRSFVTLYDSPFNHASSTTLNSPVSHTQSTMFRAQQNAFDELVGECASGYGGAASRQLLLTSFALRSQGHGREPDERELGIHTGMVLQRRLKNFTDRVSFGRTYAIKSPQETMGERCPTRSFDKPPITSV